MNYYELLEISENASEEVIHMAYKALVKKYHPDVYAGDKSFAEEKMKAINEAYSVLSDLTKRLAFLLISRQQKFLRNSLTVKSSTHRKNRISEQVIFTI